MTKLRQEVRIWLGILAAVICSLEIQAAEPALRDPALDQAFAHLRSFDWGESREAMGPLDEAINASVSDSSRRAQLETRLVAVLATDATPAAKRFVCERLSRIGSASSVPALASLLGNPATSHPARLALERIAGPQASEALRLALPQVEDKLKIGIINSLGVMKDPNAVGLLTNLLASPKPELAGAAASALGQIATLEAGRALGEFRRMAPKDLEAVATDAWLATAEGFLDRGERAAAAGIFRQLFAPGQAVPLRLAGFRGLVAAQPEKAAALLSQAVAGDDEPVQNLAARLLADGRASFPLTPFIASLRTYPPAGQVAVLEAVRERREAAARPAVLEAAQSQQLTVRLAALRALAVIGAAYDVSMLARLVEGAPGEENRAALFALAHLPGKEVSAAIITQMAAASPAARIELISALVSRRAVEASPAIAEHLADASEQVRKASIEALGALGGEKQIPPILKLLAASPDDRTGQAAERTLKAIAGRVGANCAEPLLAGLKDAKPGSQLVLLRVLGIAGGAQALEAVRAALQSPEVPVRDTAFRVLTEWPGAEAAPDLLRLAQARDNPYRALLAFRGYVRLCRETRKPVAEKVQMLAEVTAIAKTAAQRRLLIAALGELPDRAVFKLLGPFFADPDLVEETCLAAVKVAAGLDTEGRDAAVPALRQVVKLSKNPHVRDQAQKTMERLGVKPDSVSQ